MSKTRTENGSSLRRQLLFWWILLVVLQSAERLFLLKDAVQAESPSPGLLFQTLVIGLRGDFIVATIALALAGFAGSILAGLLKGVDAWRGSAMPFQTAYRLGLRTGGLLLAVTLFVLLFVDMGYYGHHRQRLDFVFLEYVGDLFSQVQASGQSPQQAAKQTDAELGDWSKWGIRIAQFLVLELLAIGAWWWAFVRGVGPALARWRPTSSLHANTSLGLCLLAGAAGFHHQGPYGIRIANISSTVYYTLAQNPVLFASEALRVSLVSGDGVARARDPHALAPDDALQTMQRLIGPNSDFPDPRFPLIKTAAAPPNAVHLEHPANIVLIFIEGLDRRFLGRTYGGIPGTPFLDRFREESLYFENFFSNGVQTSRGLFATFCSYYPRHGAAAMKTRYAHDYACLPSWLEQNGYRTEFVIGQHRDLNRLQTFMARNGLRRLVSESDFPPGAERIGLGMSDGALFSLMRARLEELQAFRQPFMLGTLTLATHHPFGVPNDHPEVRELLGLPDKYIAALRYTDLKLERLFADLRRQELLRNTVVFILGDHGRHENVGSTEFERQAGHFASPLLVWMDDSLRSRSGFRPRTVSTVASHVDILPTILSLNGIVQPMAPSLGRDLTCLFVQDCLQDNFAFLTSMYDDAIGLATSEGLLMYSLRTERLTEADLSFQVRAGGIDPTDPAVARRFHDLMALYQASNTVLDQNRIWSWKEYGSRL
ncbi:MAG TPA: LTA synthase family protein [Nitrospiraceae bacterium]|nr:LTA synthase family protein [Nitrospiraceae bacterium]